MLRDSRNKLPNIETRCSFNKKTCNWHTKTWKYNNKNCQNISKPKSASWYSMLSMNFKFMLTRCQYLLCYFVVRALGEVWELHIIKYDNKTTRKVTFNVTVLSNTYSRIPLLRPPLLRPIASYCRTGHFHGHDMFADFADFNKIANISCQQTRFVRFKN